MKMRLFLLISFSVFSTFAADAVRPVVHVTNFGVVNPHLLRGAEPSVVGLTELGSAGVKVVIDLRESSAATAFEKKKSEQLGMKYTNVPLAPLNAPTPEQIRVVLNLIAQSGADTVFLHCQRGKDRTGTVVACYRVQHDGWNNDRALQEARQYGMSFIQRGMQSFILHFTPTPGAVDLHPTN